MLQYLVLWELIEKHSSSTETGYIKCRDWGSSKNNCKFLWSIYYMLVGLTNDCKFF